MIRTRTTTTAITHNIRSSFPSSYLIPLTLHLIMIQVNRYVNVRHRDFAITQLIMLLCWRRLQRLSSHAAIQIVRYILTPDS